MKEQWKDIKGYEGKYQISNLGRVKSLDYHRSGKEKEIIPVLKKTGYYQVNLYLNGRYKTKRIHRLVAEAFVDNENNCSIVNHIDGDKTNNCASNLEWTTVQYNTWHATHIIKTNVSSLYLATEASKKPCSIINTETNDVLHFGSRKEAEDYFGCEFRSIVGSRQKKIYKHLKLVEEVV